DRRHRLRPRHRRHHGILREGRAVEARRRGTAHRALHRDHRGRDRGVSRRHASPAELEALCARALERARAHGAQGADARAESSRAFTVRAHGGSIESLKQSGTLGLGLRALVGGAVGFASGTDLSAAGLDDLARRAVALARFATPDEANGAPEPGEVGVPAAGDLDLLDGAALEWSPERKIEMA